MIIGPSFHPSYRLIPSRFPPIGLFDRVATSADLSAVMELVGWTNDRLVAERVKRLPQKDWVYGVANASVVMAAFLHVAPGGMRFNGEDLGAWYAGDDIRTCAAEVGHHLRREAVARKVPTVARQYRAYSARLDGDFRDIRGHQHVLPAVYAPDSYSASQKFGEDCRRSGEAGILYDSLRRVAATCAVAYQPRLISNVLQTDHYEITVFSDERLIDVRRLNAS